MCKPVLPVQFFDVAACLAKQISAQEAAGTFDEPDHNIPDDLVDDPPSHPHFWINPSPPPLPAHVVQLDLDAQMTILVESQQSLVWKFVGSVFAACTFNFGPHTITVPHLDFGNLSWGWCAITALGHFNPDLGGHLVLWDLKLII
ncbi:hypothetical protein B0H14DRAFT_2653532 [Mycena olivaceomarginata]|nr:hypothetical protein B0H14DRAFT_2653532 [Mycena olivaceomarginata]